VQAVRHNYYSVQGPPTPFCCEKHDWMEQVCYIVVRTVCLRGIVVHVNGKVKHMWL